MKGLQSSILLFSITILFLGNSIGLDVFKHFCRTEGTVSVAYVLNNNNHCETDKAEIPKCCQSENPKEKKECCDDELEHFQISLDFSKDAESFYISHLNASVLPINIISAYQNNKKDQIGILHYSNPPPLSSKETLILHQVFVI